MSELMNARGNGRDFRRQLLMSGSVLALLATLYGANPAKADGDDADRPPVWIELGGQIEHLNGTGQLFDRPFFAEVSHAGLASPLDGERPPPFSNGAEGKISFEPEGTNWVFSGTIRYGRSNFSRHIHAQTPGILIHQYRPRLSTYNPTLDITYPAAKRVFVDTEGRYSESHAVLDFQAGKDVGLGMFGRSGMSVLSLGVRFAQFTVRTDMAAEARPTLQVQPVPSLPPGWIFSNVAHFRSYEFTGSSKRSFHAIGPSLSWNASAPVFGNGQVGEALLEWGVNAAVLFGRQKASVQHHGGGLNYSEFVSFYQRYKVLYQTSKGTSRTHSVTVPNVGGFAGLSYRIENFKVSAGYRADLFFGAIDGGIDTRKEQTLGFYGPFATISVGIGG